MNSIRRLRIMVPILLAAQAFAANPFLDAKDDKPASANFRGTEWNDENIEGEIPLTARLVTTRIAQMPWGAIFKIEFVGLKSRAKKKREIPPQYFHRHRRSHFPVERRKQRRRREENFGNGQTTAV